MERCSGIHGVLAGCARCGGLFIDNRAGAALLSRALDEEAQAFIEGFDRTGSAPSGPGGGAFRSAATTREQGPVCPVCEGALRVARLEGDVEVDVCDAHGTFFDRLELRALLFARAEAQASEHARAVQRATAIQHEAEHFRHDVREPSDYMKKRYPLAVYLRKLLYDLTRRR